MGTWYYKRPDGQNVGFTIKGDTPSPTEMERINAILTGKPANTEEVVTPTPKEDEPGIGGAFVQGIGVGWNAIQAGANRMGQSAAENSPTGEFLGYNANAWRLAAKAQDREAQDKYWSPDKSFFEEEGAYNKVRNLAATAGQSAIPTFAGLGAAAMTGGAGGFALAAGAGALTAAPQMFKENVDTQIAEHGRVKDWNKAWVATGINSAIEGISDRVTFGVAGIAGKSARQLMAPIVAKASKAAAEKAAKEIAERSIVGALGKKVGTAAAMGFVTGAIEEATQAAVTRWNAEKPLGGPEAQREYLENAIVGGLLQGAIGAGVAPIGVVKETKAHNAWQQAVADADQHLKKKSELFANATKETPPAPEPAFMQLEDHSAPSTEQLYIKEKPLSMAGVKNLTANLTAEKPKPVRTDVPTEEEYRRAVDGLREEKSVSAGKVRTFMKVHDSKAKAIVEMAVERGDAHVINPETGYIRFKRGEMGARTPDRKTRVGPVDVESREPFTIRRPNGNQIGNLKFKTAEAAQKWAMENRVIEKIPAFEIHNDTTGQQYGVYEDSFETKKDAQGIEFTVKVGSRLLRAFSDPKEANAAAKEFDPNFSPETIELTKEQQELAKQEIIRQQVDVPLQNAMDEVLGADRAELQTQDLVTGGDVNARDAKGNAAPSDIIEGVTLAGDAEGRIKQLIMVARKLLDTTNPDLDLKGLVLGHELLHAMMNSGLLTKQEQRQLVNLARTMKVPGKKYTWEVQQVARGRNLTGKQRDQFINNEEIVAEMLRGYVMNPQAFSKSARPLMQKLVDFLKKFLRLSTNDGRDLLDAIYNRGLLKDRPEGFGDTPRRSESRFFSAVPVQGFYMKSYKTIENAKQDKASADQWMGLLRNANVKEEELTWLDLEQALRDYQDYHGVKVVPRTEVLDYIKANGLEVHETVLGMGKINARKRDNIREAVWDKYFASPEAEKNEWAFSAWLSNRGLPDDFDTPATRKAFQFEWIREAKPKEPLIVEYKRLQKEAGDLKGTRYHNISQGGGEDYFEIVFTLPNNRLEGPLGKVMPPRHFTEIGANQIAHVRARTNYIDGKKALMVEEVQSDWIQKGKQEGFNNAANRAKRQALEDDYRAKQQLSIEAWKRHTEAWQYRHEKTGLFDDLMAWQKANPDGDYDAYADQAVARADQAVQDAEAAAQQAHNEMNAAEEKVIMFTAKIPDAPLKSSWEEFVFRRMVRWAAENDFDYIAWHGEGDSVALTEGYHNFREEAQPDGSMKYFDGSANRTSIVNRYLHPSGLRSVSKRIGKRFNAMPFLYDPKVAKTPTGEEAEPLFDNANDIQGLLANYDMSDEIRRKLNALAQLLYTRGYYDFDPLPAEALAREMALVNLTNEEIQGIIEGQPSGRGIDYDDNQQPVLKKWLWPMVKDLKESSMGEGFPLFSAVPRSPEFQEWFRGSKVVNDNGEPMVMYHGTSKDKDFKKFNTGKRGAWFTSSPAEASDYARDNDSKGFKIDGREIIRTNERDRVIPVYLSIKNPKVMTNEDHDAMNHNPRLSYQTLQAAYFDRLKAQGYDGVNLGGGIWVAFEPSQIKSVFNTKFVSSDPRFSKITQTPQFEQWFRGSAITDTDGHPVVMYHSTGAQFDEFGRVGVLDHGWYGQGFYFTQEATMSQGYLPKTWFDSEWDKFEYKPGGRMIPAYLALKNPYIWPMGKKPFLNHAESEAFTKDLKDKGYDGVIKGSYSEDGAIEYFEEVIAFYPNQIKSIWNQAFDPADPKYSVWHGSPNDFERFDHQFMGTGQGAQVYGWGTYAGGKREIGETFRDHNLPKAVIKYDLPEDLVTNRENYALQVPAGTHKFIPYDVTQTIAAPRDVRRALQFMLQEMTDGVSMREAPKKAKEYHWMDYPLAETWNAAETILKRINPRVEKPKGHLYELDIPDDREFMIWDIDFNLQPDYVQNAILHHLPYNDEARAFFERTERPSRYTRFFEGNPDLFKDTTGQYIYSYLTDIYGSPKGASLALKAAGIAGNRYIANGISRGEVMRYDDPKTVYNYVIFDEDDIEIVARYSAVAPLGQRVPATPDDAAIRQVEQNMTYDNLSRVLQKVVGKTPFASPRVQKVAENFIDGSIIQLQDRMLPLAQMIDRLRANGNFISNETDTYLEDQLRVGQTQYAIENAKKIYYDPLARAIKNIDVTDEEFSEANVLNQNAGRITFVNRFDKDDAIAELYLYAQHAQERNAVMRERNEDVNYREHQAEYGSGMKDEDAQEILDWVRSKPHLYRRLADLTNENSVRSRMRALIKYTNDVRFTSGLNPDFSTLDFSEAGNQVKQYEDYVPLRSFLQEHTDNDKEAMDFVRAGRGYRIQGNEDPSALGRVSLGRDIVAHAVMQNMEAITRAGNNQVAMSFVNLVREHAEELEPYAEIVDVVPMRFALDRKAGRIRRIHDQRFTLQPDILVGKEDGNEVMVRIKDPRLQKALLTRPGMGNGIMQKFGDGLLWINRGLAAVRTAYSPEFMISNFLRDLQAAALNISENELEGLRTDIIKSVWSALKGVAEGVRNQTADTAWGKVYEEFRKAGGQTAHMGRTELSDVIKQINKTMLEGQSNPRAIWKAMRKFTDFVEDYNTVIENGIRVAAFEHLRKRFMNGSTDPAIVNRANKRAAFMAKNMTVNFNMGGEAKPFMNALYLFYNASMQGSVALINPLIRSKRVRKLWAGVIFAGLMQDILMSMISPDDEDGNKIYDNIPDYILDNNMIFMDFGLVSEKGYLAFPMPYLMNGIYGIGRNIGRTARGVQSPMEGAISTAGVLAQSLNPWGASNTFLNWMAPTIVDPIVDLALNKDAFGKSISPEGNPFGLDEKASARYWNNTSPFYTAPAAFFSNLTGSDGAYIPGYLEISPNQFEYVANFAGGAAWTFAQRTWDFFSPAGTGVLFDVIAGEDFSVNDIPLLRKFAGNVSSRQDMEYYLNNRDKVLQVRKELREASQAGDSERYQYLMREYPVEYRISAQINALENQRRKLSQRLNKIRENDKLSSDQKAAQEKLIKEQMDKVVGKANSLLRET